MLGRWFDHVLSGLNYLAVALLLGMGGSVLYEIFMRYLFNRPTRWVVEFSEYALLYIGFLAGASVLRQDGHVKIELLVEALSPRLQRLLHRVTAWVGAGVCGLFCWFSASLTWEIFETGELLFRSVHVPKWAVLIVIPVGMLLLTLQFVRRALTPGREPAETPGV